VGVGGDTRLVHKSQIKASVYAAIQNLLLAASALGIGSCLTTITTLKSDIVRDMVGFPPEVEPLALVPLGRPRRSLGPPRREPVSVKAHRERYGAGWSN
jgi:nitroreductase